MISNKKYGASLSKFVSRSKSSSPRKQIGIPSWESKSKPLITEASSTTNHGHPLRSWMTWASENSKYHVAKWPSASGTIRSTKRKVESIKETLIVWNSCESNLKRIERSNNVKMLQGQIWQMSKSKKYLWILTSTAMSLSHPLNQSSHWCSLLWPSSTYRVQDSTTKALPKRCIETRNAWAIWGRRSVPPLSCLQTANSSWHRTLSRKAYHR